MTITSIIERVRKIDGWLTGSQIDLLNKCVRVLKPGSLVVEIGTYRGKSTMAIALSNRTINVITIDPCDFPFTETTDRSGFKLYNAPIAQELLEEAGNIFQVIGKSEEVVKTFFLPIDFMFIDGLHEQCDKDIENWFPKVRTGGLIAFHDFDEPHPEVLNPVTELMNSKRAYLYSKVESMCVVKKVI